MGTWVLRHFAPKFARNARGVTKIGAIGEELREKAGVEGPEPIRGNASVRFRALSADFPSSSRTTVALETPQLA